MLTYLSAVLSGEAEPFWPHVVLLSVSILAAFTVGVGIILESPKYSAAAHRVATWLVLGGIAVESLCTVFLFGFDESISFKQQSTIEAQNSQIIALETQLAPRFLTEEQFNAIQALKGRIPAINLAVEADSECQIFSAILASALMSADIKVRSYTLPVEMHSSSGLVIYDANMFSDDSAGKAIFDALSNHGLTARGKISRLPDALDMPRDIPAILVYEKLFNVPGSATFFPYRPAGQAAPVPAK